MDAQGEVKSDFDGFALLTAPIMLELERGMELKKCRKCGCMKDALYGAALTFGNSEEEEVQALLPTIEAFRAQMEPLAYDCIGCKKCFGADATKQLSVRFEEIETDSCGGSCGSHAQAPVQRLKNVEGVAWPPYPGDYIVGAPGGSVAVCTLSSRELSSLLIAAGDPIIAIAGRCDTENIGVEKVVLNLLANPGVRWLILCGYEAEGHRTGDAFLNLKEKGVDANMRVLESASWRPVLKNLTLVEVARFREQIEIINLVGVTDVAQIAMVARDLASRSLPPLSAFEHSSLSIERIKAKAPERLKLDPAGFFIVLPLPETGLILCEHYENNGQLAHVIEGRLASLIASTAVEHNLITRLDHAAYLGRELAKAELSLKTGALYEQDAALGTLPPLELAEVKNPTCENTESCACN